MADELDLGIPARQQPQPIASPNVDNTVRRWTRYSAGSRRFCDVCLPAANTAPTKPIGKAWWTEDGPDGRLWLCHEHKSDREVRDQVG